MNVPPGRLITVLDSSMLVPRWSRYVLQRLAERPNALFVPFWSEWIIAETWRTLATHWLDRAARVEVLEGPSLTRAANDMLRYLMRVMQLVSLRGYTGPLAWPELTDPDDEPIWQTAMVAQVQFVVSNNVRHFPPLVEGRHLHRGVEYVTAVEFIEGILGENAEAVYEAPLPTGARLRSRRASS